MNFMKCMFLSAPPPPSPTHAHTEVCAREGEGVHMYCIVLYYEALY